MSSSGSPPSTLVSTFEEAIAKLTSLFGMMRMMEAEIKDQRNNLQALKNSQRLSVRGSIQSNMSSRTDGILQRRLDETERKLAKTSAELKAKDEKLKKETASLEASREAHRLLQEESNKSKVSVMRLTFKLNRITHESVKEQAVLKKKLLDCETRLATYSECLVCYQKFDENTRIPRVMDCGHTLCDFCINQIVKMAGCYSATCPFDRVRIFGFGKSRRLEDRPCNRFIMK